MNSQNKNARIRYDSELMHRLFWRDITCSPLATVLLC